ncbi:MAG TPA: 3-oxoacyl-[acyl-carrier-protein] reductase [Candidatus Limnocylindrales bacterium]|nr:3-oxoacyl-[acyl-carrier-protein] reductase [Candidatus Limnocylindrales bacterium]
MGDFEGKVALVTGAGRGIGKAVSLELAAQGATVVINYLNNPEAAQDVVDTIVAAGGQALALQADVSIEADANALVKSVVDTYGKLDILVNNAGITRDGLIMMMAAEDFDLVIQNNLRSAWLMSKAAAKTMMRKRTGTIINLSSISGIMGNGGQSNYSASKAGLIGLTKSLARELSGRSIRVNAVAPGFIQTDLTATMPTNITEKLIENIPLQRWGTVEDVAHAVVFLASERASYITGHVLVVDGGLAM